jgi:desumoylating isopeptidase 1
MSFGSSKIVQVDCPSLIDLPSDFLSTPLGAALRPMIDSMFLPRGQESAPPSLPSQVDSSLQSLSLDGGSSSASPPVPGPANSLTSPIHVCTNPASMQSILKSHRAVVAFFTSATCGPCRMIEPVFEGLAEEKTRDVGGSAASQVAFVKIDHDVGLGGAVAREYGIRVTPTFLFFLDGRKVRGGIIAYVIYDRLKNVPPLARLMN